MIKSQKEEKKIVSSSVRLEKSVHKKIKVFLANNEDYDGNLLTLNALNHYLYNMLLTDKEVQGALKKHIKSLTKGPEQHEIDSVVKQKQKPHASDEVNE